MTDFPSFKTPSPAHPSHYENRVVGNEYKLNTSIKFDTGHITQDLVSPDPMAKVMTWIVDTREAQIREALIKLGWTPPAE